MNAVSDRDGAKAGSRPSEPSALAADNRDSTEAGPPKAGDAGPIVDDPGSTGADPIGTGPTRRRQARGDPLGGDPAAKDPRQRGFVTAEMAAVLPAVVAVLALGLWAVATVGTKVRAIDAANSAAIAAARSEDPHAVAAAYLPDGGSVTVSEDGTVARAVVTVPVRPLGPLTPPMSITAAAAAPLEPGVT